MYSTGKKTHTGQYRGLRLFLRLLSRPRFRPSRGRRAGVSLGLDGCEVRLCDPCARVSRVSEITHRHTFTFTQSLHSRSRLPRCLFTGSRYRVQYRYPVCARVSAWVWVDGCEVRPCDPCARVRPCVPCVPCVSRLPPVSFYRYLKLDEFDLSSPRDDPSDTTHAGAPKGGAALHGRSLRHKRQYCCGP